MSNAYGLSDNEFSSRRYYKALNETYLAAKSFACCFRLFFAESPRTPLRVLCIMAFDVVHVLYKQQCLSHAKVRLMADVLDFAAGVNSAVDGKRFDAGAYQRSRVCIDRAGAGQLIDGFATRLEEIERRSREMMIVARSCENVQAYREDVVRLNMGVLAAVAFDLSSFSEGVRFTHSANIEILFRIVMLLQIVDDVLDYRDDTKKGLPSFLTASELIVALRHSQMTADRYARDEIGNASDNCFPFRLAIICVHNITKAAIHYAGWRFSQRIG